MRLPTRCHRGASLAAVPALALSLLVACSRDGAERPAIRERAAPAAVAASPGPAGDRLGDSASDTAAVLPPFGAETEHLSDIRQLTFGGQNAEAYWSAGDERIVFQATPDSLACDQIFTMRPDGRDKRMVSTGRGVTTCGYFLDSAGSRILYSSTHLAGPECPPRPGFERGYVWPVHPGYDVFAAPAGGGEPVRLTTTPGYDAEATVSRDGRRIVFTSVRDGDLELYSMAPDGGDVRRLTREPGYDGGAFFSYDGRRIVWRAHHPADPAALAEDRELLRQGLVRPSRMEIWVMDADGSNKRQVTRNGAANFAPFFFPDGERIVFASNLHDPDGRNFDLYAVRIDGTGLERITHHPDFDAFPMFDSRGERLLWASNRNAAERGETNVFVARWHENSTPR